MDAVRSCNVDCRFPRATVHLNVSKVLIQQWLSKATLPTLWHEHQTQKHRSTLALALAAMFCIATRSQTRGQIECRIETGRISATVLCKRILLSRVVTRQFHTCTRIKEEGVHALASILIFVTHDNIQVEIPYIQVIASNQCNRQSLQCSVGVKTRIMAYNLAEVSAATWLLALLIGLIL